MHAGTSRGAFSPEASHLALGVKILASGPELPAVPTT